VGGCGDDRVARIWDGPRKVFGKRHLFLQIERPVMIRVGAFTIYPLARPIQIAMGFELV